MARGHQKQGVAGAFGHSGRPDTGYQFRGRETGGKLHRRGKKSQPTKEAVHVEKIETSLEPKIVATLERLNAGFETVRAAEADRIMRDLKALAVPFDERRARHQRAMIAQYCK